MSFKPKPGKRFPIAKTIRIVCCDCQLVHVFRFRVGKDGQLSMSGTRDDKATARRRRRKHVRLELRWVANKTQPKAKSGR